MARKPKPPSCQLDADLSQKHGLVAAIADAGTKAIAGPIISFCVVVKDAGSLTKKLVDDCIKAISEGEVPDVLEQQIKLVVLRHGVGSTSPQDISVVGVDKAREDSRRDAFVALMTQPVGPEKKISVPDACIFAGQPTLGFTDVAEYMVVDVEESSSALIAAVLALSTRNRYMERLSLLHVEMEEKYAFSDNKGEKDKKHDEAVKKHGASGFHRITA